jgi:CrcB protein
MSAAVLVGIGLLGGVGAIARFLLDGAVAGTLGRDFPYGTLAVNLTGSFALGACAGLALDGDAYRVAATGLLGSFTTFSTWALESHRLGEDGQLRLGIANLVLSLVLGVAAVWVGHELGAAL